MTLPAIIQHYLDAYNRKDVAALVACVADAVVFENVSNAGPGMKIQGRAAFAELALQAATMSPRATKRSGTPWLRGIKSPLRWIGRGPRQLIWDR